MTSGQKSAQALIILKEGFENIEISKDDFIIKDILEGVKSYEQSEDESAISQREDNEELENNK